MGKSWFLTDRAHRLILFALVFIIIACVSHADGYRPWAGEFLRMGAGARALGMGNAYSAVDGDIFSYYYNPAGLSSMTNRQLALSFRYLANDRYFKDIVFGTKIGPDASFALSWINAGTNDIMGRDLNGRPTGSLADSRNSFAVTFSKQFHPRVSVGINAKVAVWKLAGEDAKAVGLDAGILVRPIDSFTASFVIRDLNSRFTWNSSYWKDIMGSIDGQPLEKEDKLPLYYTAGCAYKLLQDKLLIATTFEFLEDNPLGIDVGASYILNPRFTARTGVYNYTTSDEVDSSSLTAGFSVQVTG
ncbi:PorV/PorQ family protein, partial [Candidatus Latescibacterota bacterium]